MSLRILTWHIHGSYLYYLSHIPHQLLLPVKDGRPPGYSGRSGTFPWPDSVIEVPAEEVRDLEFDCVLYQHHDNWLADQHELLSPEQRRLPRIYLEHDPPRRHPTDTRHPVDDPDVLIVHVTPFNALMWDSGANPVRVIDHGVVVPEGLSYTGELDRGLVIINNIARRGRRLGLDVWERVRQELPLDLVGMNSGEAHGLGEVPPDEIAAFEVRYRFVFNPIRYTSLGLAVCEAMMLGIPVVGLATTEMSTAVVNGVNGYVDTRIDRLVEHMRRLLADPEEARRLGEGARRYAEERFGIDRFVADWEEALAAAVQPAGARAVAGGVG